MGTDMVDHHRRHAEAAQQIEPQVARPATVAPRTRQHAEAIEFRRGPDPGPATGIHDIPHQNGMSFAHTMPAPPRNWRWSCVLIIAGGASTGQVDGNERTRGPRFFTAESTKRDPPRAGVMSSPTGREPGPQATRLKFLDRVRE